MKRSGTSSGRRAGAATAGGGVGLGVLCDGALLDGEAGDDLRLVVVEDLGVFFFESTYCVALPVADQD